MLEALSAQGSALWSWLEVMLLWTAGITLAARALDALLERRLAPGWRIALYAALPARLLLPVGWAVKSGVTPPLWVSLAPETAVAVGATPALAAAPQASTPLAAAGLLLYAAAALGLLALLARRHRALAALRRSGRRLDAPLLDPGCPVLAHPDAGPLTTGLLRPVVLIPEALLARPALLYAALRHEAAHVARRDAWLALAMQLVLAVCWPILPLWLAARRVRQLMELDCDARALRDPALTPRRYGEALLALTEPYPVAPAALAWLGRGAARALSERVRALGRLPNTPRWIQAMTTFALTLLLALGTSARSADFVDAPAPDAAKIQYDVAVYQLDRGDARAVDAWLAGVTPDALRPEEAAALSALVEQRGAGLITRPTLLALEGQEAVITQGDPTRETSVRLLGEVDQGTIDVALSLGIDEGGLSWSGPIAPDAPTIAVRADGDQRWLLMLTASVLAP